LIEKSNINFNAFFLFSSSTIGFPVVIEMKKKGFAQKVFILQFKKIAKTKLNI